MSYRFREIFIATVILFGVALVLSILPIKFEFIKPIKQEFDDFDIYDLFYSGKSAEHPGDKDTSIVLIQAADSRPGIDSQINIIKSLQPKVLGIDLSFENITNDSLDRPLIASIRSNSSIVTGYAINTETKDSVTIADKMLPKDYLMQNGGYINFAHTDSNSVIRSIAPFYKKNGKEYLAFSTRIIKKYLPKLYNDYREGRNNKTEFIHYYGNIDYYINYSASEFDRYNKENQLRHIKDKIVLLGFFSKDDDKQKVMEDARFTPLNPRTNGRGFPDTYGVVIHANIISMMLKGEYVHAAPLWLSYIIAFGICLLVVWYVFYSYKKHRHPSHIRLFIFMLIATISCLAFFVTLYSLSRIRVHLVFIILSMVLCVEMFDIYKKLAIYFNKRKKGWTTFFSDAKTNHS